MKYFPLFFLIFCSFANAKQTTFNGEVIETERKIILLECSSFQVETYIENWPLKFEESALCSRDTLGFMGMCLYTAWENTLVTPENTRLKLPKIHELNLGSERLLKDRYYIESPSFCEGNKVYFSLWGGGNCRNGCEAFGYIEMNEANEVIGSGLIPYSEYKEKKSNK